MTRGLHLCAQAVVELLRRAWGLFSIFLWKLHQSFRLFNTFICIASTSRSSRYGASTFQSGLCLGGMTCRP